MDFDDLITNTVFLLRNEREVLDGCRAVFEYVLVDEYQDTNTSQFYLVRLLSSAHGNVFVVGDDDQSIYGWRGAQIENILSFEQHFPNTTAFKLEENYRSTQTILSFANAVIGCNTRRTPKELWTGKGGGPDVVLARYADDRQEAEGTVERAGELAGTGKRLGDMAVLFRTNAQSRALEDALRKKNMPYVLVGGVSFYDRKEIKDCLAYLRLLVNPKDDVSCERILNVPSRGIGTKSREALAAQARAGSLSLLEVIMGGICSGVNARSQKGLDDLRDTFEHMRRLVEQNTAAHTVLEEMLTVTGYVDALESEETEEAERRLENVNELMNALAIWHEENEGATLADFLEEVSLVTDVDRWDRDTDALNLMTLHSAKGLEFSAVFLVGVEDGLLPSRQNIDDETKLEEECRLFYVGATRAKELLECSHVNQRWRFGSLMPMEPSRFLAAVPETAYRFVDHTRV
jgi:DNA helicase-2/ATP-dependent DNA helicase PcrA